jgi:hypothetical protein
VRRRLRMKGFSGWFMVEAEKTLLIGNEETKIIYIRAKNPNELISKEDDTTVGVFARVNEGEKVNLVFVDWAVVK